MNIYDLGLIYKIDVKDDATVDIDMTFTAPTCPAADFILEDVRQKVDALDGVKSATVNLVFEPAWDQSMLSEEARLELGVGVKKLVVKGVKAVKGVKDKCLVAFNYTADTRI